MSALPNLVVIGAMKCGTSSLHYYLGLHPKIEMSERKELNFFLPDEPEPGGERPAGDLELMRERSSRKRGIEWYRSQFAPAPVRGESSVAYTFPWYPSVADEMARVLEEPRLIYLVRDPLERMLSHHDQFSGRDPRDLETALLAPGNPYLDVSRYATAIGPFLEHFGPERVMVVLAEDLWAERPRTMASILSFLGVDPGFYPEGMATERNVSAAKGDAYRLAERVRGSRIAGAALTRVPVGLRARAERLLSRGAGPTTGITPELEAACMRELEPEIRGLEELSGLDLDRWRRR